MPRNVTTQLADGRQTQVMDRLFTVVYGDAEKEKKTVSFIKVSAACSMKRLTFESSRMLMASSNMAAFARAIGTAAAKSCTTLCLIYLAAAQ